MDRILFLIPLIPLGSSLFLGLFGGMMRRKLPKRTMGAVGTLSIASSAVISIVVGAQFLAHPPPDHFYFQKLWTWMAVGSFAPAISLRLDALSLIMCVVVSGVGFLIHLYSIEFMEEEKGYSRFFAYMNLFVASMLTLVLAGDLLLLYLGWEGVGLCSYLLIGFWYEDPANGRAARKAFIVTRVGDTAMAVGLFILFLELGTLEIEPMLRSAAAHWQTGSAVAIATAALLLAGAVGKSAQLPLQTWLPDAMAGPTPVSALIHAATMVTAGVYLIARTHVIFELAPAIQTVVAIVGAATLLISSFSALVQTDIKRVLAYSTISQIGYMFLALGVTAWPAAIFHLMTHAFYKALLFLSAGAVTLALHHEHDIFKMGGLRKKLPGVFWAFLIGTSALSAVPFLTSGFYSKDLILEWAYASRSGSPLLWAAGILGAFLTSLYSFRLFFIVFLGKERTPVSARPGSLILVPLGVLATLSLLGGFFDVPSLLSGVFPGGAALPRLPGWVGIAPSVASLLGILAAYFIYASELIPSARLVPRAAPIARFLYAGWGFDFLYDRLFVRPLIFLSYTGRDDFIDLFFDGVAWLNLRLNRALSIFQTGRVRWYAAMLGAGAVVLIFLSEIL